LTATSKTGTRKAKAAGRGETPDVTKKRVRRLIVLLKADYPEARTALAHEDPFQLLVATILSAQCTDVRVNMVTPKLFARFPNAQALALARSEELEALIHSTGFFRNKARNLIGCARGLVAHHKGKVPDSMEALTALDGVGRKTANVVLGSAFGKHVGVVVDTHVSRLSNLLGLTSSANPEQVERDLMALVPKRAWTLFSHLLIYHGRAVCIARRPQCAACSLYEYCPGRKEERSPAMARKSRR
jgi:endonuclease-3